MNVAFVVAANFGDVTGGGHVWMTSNKGQSWTNISGNLPSQPVWSLQIDPSGVLYVGADNGVYSTGNGGSTWSRFGAGFPNAQVYQIALNSSLHILAAATHGRGAWEILTTSPPVTVTNVTSSTANGTWPRPAASRRIPRKHSFADDPRQEPVG